MKDERRPAKNAVPTTFDPGIQSIRDAEELSERIEAALKELDSAHDVIRTVLEGALDLIELEQR
jgi:hypothetical protein